MKGKFCSALLALVMVLLMLPGAAFADVIFEPDDVFYNQHRDECTYLNRGFRTNGAEGYVPVYSAPGALMAQINAPNGKTVYISHVWKDEKGCEWGVGSDGGWIRLSDLALYYRSDEFIQDHREELAQYDGSANALEEMCLYSYPGGSYGYTVKRMGSEQDFAGSLAYLYTDGEGRRWTHLGYYMGRHDAWLCIDDPMNEGLGTDSPLTVEQVRAGTEPVPAAGNVPVAFGYILPVAAGLVAAAAVLTAILLRSRRKPKTN